MLLYLNQCVELSLALGLAATVVSNGGGPPPRGGLGPARRTTDIALMYIPGRDWDTYDSG